MEPRKNNVLKIFMVGYSDHKGGVETYIDRLASALDPNRYKLVYCLPVMEINGKTWRRPPNRHNYLKYRLFWSRFFRENRFDVLYYNACDVVSLDMLRFAKNARIPIRILHCHSVGVQQAIEQKLSLFHRLTERWNRRVLDRYATNFLACSEEAGKWMFGDRPFTLVKNGVSLAQYRFSDDNRRRLRQALNFGDAPIVGFVGRFSSAKNPLLALRVIQELLKLAPQVRAVFLGDGDLRRKAEQEVAQAGIGDSVIFKGNVDNVSEWLSTFDVLLAPSLFEGAPFALIEAQANGLPCVVSSTITRDVNVTGLVKYVDLNASPQKWSEALLASMGKRKSDVAQDLIASGYDAQSTAKTVATILDGASSACS